MNIEQIKEGLRMALARGYSLEQAATSFKNAGYPSSEVDEAMRAFQNPQFQPRRSAPPVSSSPSQFQKQVHPPQQIQRPTLPTFQYQQPKPVQKEVQKTPQKISGYGQEQKPKKRTGLIIFLVILLLVLVGALVTAFIFKTEIIDFFARLFG